MIEVKELEWDSKFFNCKVLALYQSFPDTDDEVEIAEIVQLNNPDLVYIFARQELCLNVPGYHGLLADRKLTFVKTKLNGLQETDNISSYRQTDISEQLLDLAYQSGEHSRFRVDPWFSEQQFRALYQLWLEGSVKRELAKEVFVCYKENDVVGFVTLNRKQHSGSIELTAVEEHYRGNGFGKALMQSAENWCVANRLAMLQVVTQELNQGACEFYRSCGFVPSQEEYVYHFHKGA